MEKTLRKNMLFDFYGSLLTGHQQRIYQMYFAQDMSLGEIGQQLDISRQAVYDIIKRASAALEEFEQKLRLFAKYRQQQDLFQEAFGHLAKLAKTLPQFDSDAQTAITNVQTIIEKLQTES